LYTVLMLFVPVPDPDGRIAAGALEPGRDVGAFVDRLLLSGHLWSKSKTWDPEGVVSTIPALCSQLFGVLTGRWLATPRSQSKKTIYMLAAGFVCLGVGAAIDGTFMPINKSLWTTSYCITMTGFALLMFGGFYWLIDAAEHAAVREKAQLVFRPF